jgi:UDP-N-acetylmuramoyl-L-alanine---L-glutamate ligase
VRFSDLDGASVGVWGAGREISSFADQLARRLPSASIAVAAFDATPGEDVRETLRAPGARIVVAGGVAIRSDCGERQGNRRDGAAEIVAALSGCDVVVRSPGVSIHRRELQALRAAGMEVTTATSLWLGEHGPAGVLGVTGTKGKSTTAALAFHLARAAGRTARLAGNIGVPALDLLDAEPAQLTVLELSSYHTADLQTAPQAVLVTNVSREHTDWHGSEDAYREDKLRLLALPEVRVRVINGRDAGLVSALRKPDLDTGVRTVAYGVPEGWDVRDGGVALRAEMRAAADELPLRGEHNALNLCGALAALEALGVAPGLPGALMGFEPLAHRLEPVLERDGVLWVNDSISTTPQSTLAALASFPGRAIVLIAGGQDRAQDYAELARVLADGETTLIGVPSTGARLLDAVAAAGAPAARALQAADLEQAVALARTRARSGGVVLLSPAAPSYDHYRDFEQRGERFRTLAAS